ncbi:MAG: ATP-binding protein [Chloroflexales bacterium]|nr:ATP-binding protein [Chloroflexales bacterium]
MELSFPSELGFEVIARDAVAAFAQSLGFTHGQIEDLKTALGEACTNAIEHGNSLNPGLRVDVSCCYDNEQLLIEIHDQGLRNFTPIDPTLSLADKLAGLGSLRGMGLMLIAQLMDEAGFAPSNRRGNCFRLALYRQSATI